MDDVSHSDRACAPVRELDRVSDNEGHQRPMLRDRRHASVSREGRVTLKTDRPGVLVCVYDADGHILLYAPYEYYEQAKSGKK